MEIVSILRLLRRRALLVAIGGLAALLAGLVSMYQVSPFPPKLTSRERSSGSASGRVLIAARKEPAFDLKSKVAGTLSARAVLLADLISTDQASDRIARAAGLEPDALAVLGPSTSAPALRIPLAVKAAEAAAAPPKPYVLTVDRQGQVPIISLKASAPDSTAAARVVDAAIGAFDELIAGRSSRTPALVVERLGPPVESTIVDSPKKAVAVVAVLVVFALWCAAIVVATGLARRWRRGQRTGAAPRPRSA